MENKPGKLERTTEVLQEAGINIRAMSMASAGEFGVIKLLVDKPRVALDALKARADPGFTARDQCRLIEDTPGALNRLLATLSGKESTSTIPTASSKDRALAAIILEDETSPETARILAEKGVKTLEDDEIYTLERGTTTQQPPPPGRQQPPSARPHPWYRRS
jgi:hypothetical protein